MVRYLHKICMVVGYGTIPYLSSSTNSIDPMKVCSMLDVCVKYGACITIKYIPEYIITISCLKYSTVFVLGECKYGMVGR
jgi:hypothetical protein